MMDHSDINAVDKPSNVSKLPSTLYAIVSIAIPLGLQIDGVSFPALSIA